MDLLLVDLLNGKNETDYSAYDIASKAHYRWDRKQFIEAALLFEVAARNAETEFQNEESAKNDYLNYITRAAVCFSEAGEYERAKPLLDIAIDSDWISAGLKMDVHMVEWAYVELLRIVANGTPHDFSSLFEKAEEHCAKLGWNFPKVYSKQELLLDIAYDLGLKDVVLDIVFLIKERKPISRKLRATIKLIEQEYASET